MLEGMFRYSRGTVSHISAPGCPPMKAQSPRTRIKDMVFEAL